MAPGQFPQTATALAAAAMQHKGVFPTVPTHNPRHQLYLGSQNLAPRPGGLPNSRPESEDG